MPAHRNMLTVVALMILIMMPTFVHAANVTNPKDNDQNPTYTPLEPLPCVPGGGIDCTKADPNKIDFQNYVQYFFNAFIYICAGAAVFMIVWGGFQYMVTTSFTEKSAGLEKAKNAILGLLIVLSSYLFLRTIDPRLVAIPTTLVEPLNISYESTTNKLLGGLNSEANKYFEQNQEAKAKIDATRADQAELLKQKADLERNILELASQSGISQKTVSDICRATGVTTDSDLSAACLKLAMANVALDNDAATIKTQAAIANISQKLASCFTQDLTQVDNINNCSGYIKDAQSAAVNTWGSVANTPKEVMDYTSSAQAILKETQQFQTWAKPDDRNFGQIINMQNKAIQEGSITTPQALNNLNESTTNLIIKAGGSVEKILDGTYLNAYKDFIAPKICPMGIPC